MSRPTIRILMVLPNLRVSNGVTNFVMNYFRNVDHQEFQIDFATLSYRESPYLKEVENAGSKVFILPSIIRHPFSHLKKCKEIIDKGNYDVVHVNTLNQAIPILLIAKKCVKVRIMHSHSTEIGETKVKKLINGFFLPILLNLSNCFSACSTIAGKALFGGRPFTVIPNVIVPSMFKYDEVIRNAIRAREKVQNKQVIGSVGRLAAQKNPFFAIDVIEPILQKRNDVVYWWIGSGPLDNAVSKYIKKKNLDDRIQLFGSRDDIADLYRSLDLFFLPSLFEGFGLACLEAQAAGLPCVVSDEFPHEVDITGNVEFLTLNQNVSSWTKAIEEKIGLTVDRVTANEACERSMYSQNSSGTILGDYYRTCIGACQ